MGDLTTGLFLIGALVTLVLLGMQIAVALFSVAFAGIWLMRGDVEIAMRMMHAAAYGGIADYIFATIPLFVLMGMLVSISNVGKDTFDVAESLLRRLRGSLGVATVAANAMFAAVTGVSVASAAVFTKIAVPEMVRHGYTKTFAAGTVAGSSILGMMIPPSVLMIIYGVLAEQSIGKLFIAGVIPGVVLALGFAAVIMLMATFKPHLVFVSRTAEEATAQKMAKFSAGQLGLKIIPISLLIILVLGGLYSGFFTPTEAGAVGALGALGIALARRKLGGGNLWKVLQETGAISVGIMILLIAASYYSKMISVAGVPQALGMLIKESGLGPYGFLTLYLILVLALGMIIDSSSILLIMTPIAAPIATTLGFDLIHFGIVTVIAVEMGLLTPPFGLSVFTVKSAMNDPSVSIDSIFMGSLPFLAVMLLALFLFAAFPILSLALI